MKRVFTYMLIPQKSVGFLLRLGGMCLFLFISFLVHAQGGVVSIPGNEDGQSLQSSGVLVTSASTDVATDDGEKFYEPCYSRE